MAQLRRAKHQRQLFEEEAPSAYPRIQLPLGVQEQLRHALVEWMKALAQGINQEGGDES
jgi:hypothetical protein